jgi:hypothetical protein
MSTTKKTDTAGTAGKGDNLARWLTDARTAEFFGHAWKLKADILVCMIEGGNLADVARQHGVTRAAASKHFRRAKTIWQGGNGKLPS